MAKVVALLLSTLCVLALANFVVSKPQVVEVQGKVFCDTCRIGLVTPLSEAIQGATVRLTCRKNETNKETYSADSKTDIKGKYTFRVEGDYEDDICEVTVVNSPRKDCKEIVAAWAKGMPECVRTVGTINAVCLTNPLFFRKDKSVAGCGKLLQELISTDFPSLVQSQKFA